MCTWYSYSHPVCAHEVSAPWLVRCRAGYWKPWGCEVKETCPSQPLDSIDYSWHHRRCPDPRCLYGQKGPVWRCCNCRTDNAYSLDCRACGWDLCRACDRMPWVAVFER